MTDHATPTEYVPIAEAARRLGCSRDTIYAGIKAGTIPAIKVTPHCLRIPRRAFDQMFEATTYRPQLQLIHRRAS